MASSVEAIPGAPAKFKRALIRLGILPPDEPGDATLLGAWERMKAAEREMEANGPDAPEDADATAIAVWEAAEDVVSITSATTVEGAIVKLRRSILMTTSGRRSVAAIINDDDTDLFSQAEQFDQPTQLVIEALAALMLVVAGGEPSDPTTVQLLPILAERNELIEHISAARLTDDKADEQCGRLDAFDDRIMETPAASKDDVFAKLLLMAELRTEGSDVAGQLAATIVREAQAFAGIGRVSPNVDMQRGR